MATQTQTGHSIQSSDTYVMERNGRSRSLISQITTVLLQPVYFFRTMPASSQWVWIAFIILALVGSSAVRQSQLADQSSSGDAVSEMPPMLDPSMGIPPGGIAMDPGFGGVPTTGDSTGAPADDISQTTMTAVIAAGTIVLIWLVQAVVLSEVSMLNGAMPRLGRNFQIAVWASVPLGVMAALQLLYYAAGGTGGVMGLSLLLEDWTWYQAQSDFTKALIYSLASRATLFWLWSLLLLYLGARHALRGHVISAFIAVAAWVIIVVLVPVLSGAIEAPPPDMGDSTEVEVMPGMDEMMPEGLLPPETIDPGAEGAQSSSGAIRISPRGP